VAHCGRAARSARCAAGLSRACGSRCEVAADARPLDHELVEAGGEDGTAVAHGGGEPARESCAADRAVEVEIAVPDHERPGDRGDRPRPRRRR
jgi:hypothetical protein